MVKTIVILRHAEKDNEQQDNNLNIKGAIRSAALAPYLLNKYGTPDAIYAMGQDSPTSSIRPIQTMTPTSVLTGISQNNNYNRKNYKDMIKEISTLYNSHSDLELIFICWEHKQIRKIAKHLGISNMKIPKWKSHDYDHIWELTYNGKDYDLNIIPQHLLYGDS